MTVSKARRKELAELREAAIRGGQTIHSLNYRASEHFDMDRALDLARATLRAVYGENPHG